LAPPKPKNGESARATESVVAVLPTCDCDIADTVVTKPTVEVIAVDTAWPVLPRAVVCARACWPAIVVAVAVAFAAACPVAPTPP
jgi:hypothetical protein